VYKEFGSLLDATTKETVKEALDGARRLLDSEDKGAIEMAVISVQEAARHLTQVMLMDPTGFLKGMGSDTEVEGDGKS
jgi:citrate lyase gamma subunit